MSDPLATKPRAILHLDDGRTAAFWLPTDTEPAAPDHLVKPGCGNEPTFDDPRIESIPRQLLDFACTRTLGHGGRCEAIGVRRQVLLRW